MKDCIVIGGGLGGLSTAIRLQHAGYRVSIFEKEKTLGGKLKTETLGSYQFDLGPSTITLKEVFQNVFKSVGKDPDDYLTFYPIKDGTRNFFSDGSIVDFSSDVESVKQQIARFSTHDAANYESFLEEAKRLYDISQKQFFSQLMYPLKTKLSPSLIKDFIKIKPFKPLSDLVDQYFKHPNTKMMFNRYATYIGSSPYEAPMIFAMMAHLEGNEGIYGVKGGSYQIVRAFEKLAKELGVKIYTEHKVEAVKHNKRKITSLIVNGKLIESDLFIFNADALSVYHYLLKDHPLNKKIRKKEASLSGFTMLYGLSITYPELKHHNVFFPASYSDEFKAIFKKKTVPKDPTIYICQSSVSEPERAKHGGGNLFVLINAPELTKKVKWNEKTIKKIETRVIDTLKDYGFKDVEKRIEERYVMTPHDLKERTGAYKGSIYGMSSNTFSQAFFKVENKDPVLKNVYFVGGSTHPGGGTPMVTLSGQLVAEDIIDKYNRNIR